MPIVSTDLVSYLTGAGADGGAQTLAASSTGGFRSSSAITSGGDNNLLDDVSGAEATAGDVEYRCYCVKNNHATLELTTVKVWLNTTTGNASDTIAFAVEVPTGGNTTGSAQTIADESTAPTVNSGNVSNWSTATTKATGIGVNQGAHDANLGVAEHVFIWIKRTVTAGAAAASAIGPYIRVEGDTAA